jgi:hypothetical protein
MRVLARSVVRRTRWLRTFMYNSFGAETQLAQPVSPTLLELSIFVSCSLTDRKTMKILNRVPMDFKANYLKA